MPFFRKFPVLSQQRQNIAAILANLPLLTVELLLIFLFNRQKKREIVRIKSQLTIMLLR